MNRLYALALATVFLVAIAGIVPAGAESNPHDESAGAPADVLVVDASGDAEYASIGDALRDASDGDTVRVRPGTYRESVTVDANLTLVAPRGATLNGTTVDADAGIVVASDSRAAPVVDGFTVTGFPLGVDAQSTAGDWTLRNVAVRNVGFEALDADASTGDWLARNLTVANTRGGVAAASTDGDWTLRDAAVEDADHYGIDATDATGDWTVENATVERIGGVGVRALVTSGDWRLVNATARTTSIGVLAQDAQGNWTIRGSVVANASSSGVLLQYREGIGVSARNTSGSWRVRGTRFVGNGEAAIVAPGADPAGDATGNSWGGDGPEQGDCQGNVDCAIRSTAANHTASTTEENTPTDPRSSTTTGPSNPTPSSPSSPTPNTADRSPTDPKSASGDERSLPAVPALGGVALLVLASLGLLGARTRF